MTKPKVFVSRRIGQEAIDLIAPHAEVTARQEPGPLNREELFRSIADKEGTLLWLDKVDRDFLNAAPKLKVIVHRAVGFDNIDIASMVTPKLTTVALPQARLAAMTCSLLLDRVEKRLIGEPKELRLNPELVIRESA